MPFRGDTEELGSPSNGVYLGLLELLAKYDPFMAEHIQLHANKGRGHKNYLSSTIWEELIELMGFSVLSEIIARIKQSKYFSISLDSTPDDTHVDQLTVVFRYIEGLHPVERFLTFLPNKGHKADDIFNALRDFLRYQDIDILNCRCQSYDNASTMAGKYSGVQARVRDVNKKALFLPCAAHSINLVGNNAAQSMSSAVSFFYVMQSLYNFFTVSSHRCAVLQKWIDVVQRETKQKLYTPKPLSETRCSCKADASNALLLGYGAFTNALENIREESDTKPLVRAQVDGLLRR